MRGQDRADQGSCEEPAQVGCVETGRARMRKRQCQRSRAWRPATTGTRPHLSDVVVVLSDISQVRKVTESTHDPDGVPDRHAVEDNFQFAPSRPVVIPVKAD